MPLFGSKSKKRKLENEVCLKDEDCTPTPSAGTAPITHSAVVTCFYCKALLYFGDAKSIIVEYLRRSTNDSRFYNDIRFYCPVDKPEYDIVRYPESVSPWGLRSAICDDDPEGTRYFCCPSSDLIEVDENGDLIVVAPSKSKIKKSS